MPLQRRSGPPPYEILRSGPSSARGGSPAPNQVEPVAGSAGPGWWDAWLAQASHPVVFRLPRGYAVLLGVLIVSLMVLGYWAGYSRGYSAKAAQAQPSMEVPAPSFNAPLRIESAQTRNPSPEPLAAPTAQGASPVQPVGVPKADTRQEGLNYLVLCLCSREQAAGFVQFLAEQGVEAYAVYVDNRGFNVIDLHGFRSNELGSEACKNRKAWLTQLGRRWAQQSKSGVRVEPYLMKYTRR